jgi:hypothetical protein
MNMENMENLVAPAAENVEKTTEETPKTYTQKEVDDLMGRRVAREGAKIRKQYERQYGELLNVIRAGTGKEDVAEATETLKSFYGSKGIDTTTKAETYTDKDLAILAEADANEIISAGYDDVVEEVERLAEIGVENMTSREKAIFERLGKYRQAEERTRELAQAGVSEEVRNSKEFREFAAKFAASVPMADVYEIYKQTTKQEEIPTIGSMRSSNAAGDGVKDYYSPAEAKKFTVKDFERNPKLYDAVVRSMAKWK